MGPSRWVIGWAMVGRAEFAYFIAIFAKSLKMMDEKLFAILIWSLLYATVFAPLIFRKVLSRYMRNLGRNSVAERCDGIKGTNFHEGHMPDLEEEAMQKEQAEMKQHSQETSMQLDKANAELERVLEVVKSLEEQMKQKDQEIGTLKKTTCLATEEGSTEEGSQDRDIEQGSSESNTTP